MKNKIKTMTIVLGIILLIVLTAITAVMGYAERENTSELVNIVDDTNKGTAMLDDNLQLDYIARDIATYKNLYCAAHPQGLDEFLYYYDVSFQAVGMVDIKGNTATFYKNENGKLVSCGSVTDSTNNVIAGIFTDTVIKDEMNAGKSKNDETYIYRGYGALPYNENPTKFDRYVSVNTVTQTASHIYYDIWFEATKSVSSKAGFKREYPSFGYQETMLDILNKARVETAKKYIDKIAASEQNYNAQIYFLKCVGDTQSTNIQDLMLVKDETVDIPVSKVWNDNNNQDVNRTGSIIVKLLANGNDTGKTLKLDESNKWSATFEKLEKYNETGNEIIYTVEEEDTTGYISIITGNQTGGYTITNKQETIDIPVTKVWNDNNNQDGLRPKSITVKLYENGKPTKQTAVLTASENWNYTFTNLPKYKNQKLVTYTVQETEIEYYTATEGNESNNYTITNTHEPEQIKITVKKEWKDDNNRDGIRTNSITLDLKKNDTIIETITLDDSNSWTKTIENLKRFENGQEINYTIEEKNIPQGYTVAVTKGNVVDKEVTYTVTNTHEPEKIEIPVQKEWNDNNNSVGFRPESITVKLFADGEDTGKTLTLSESNKWLDKFGNLEKYKDGGKEINYTIQEIKVNKYETTITGNKTSGFQITNTYYDGYIEITGKVWNDGKGAKANDINGTYGDTWDKGIAGVKVTLKNSNGAPFKATYYHKDNNGNLIKDGTDFAITSDNGEYVIRVNYDNSQNVYKLYENASTIRTNLNTSYIDFEYDGIKYTTVANASKEEAKEVSSANKSKAIENATERSNIDSNYSTVTSETNTNSWESVKLTATTKNLISFGTYKDKTTTNRAEVTVE